MVLALLALTAIIEPILIWKASKTEKQRALDALDHNLAESGGFVTKGLEIWPGIRLLRRIKAPNMTITPSLAEARLTWDTSSRQVSSASSSWVKLGLVLRAYHISSPRSDSLIIDDRKTLLPVHYVWLLLIGIFERFGKRSDEGKLPQQRPKGLLSAQARPGNMLSKRVREAAEARPGWMTDRPSWARSTSAGSSYGADQHASGRSYIPLHGLIGTIYFPRRRRHDENEEHDRVQFQNHTSLEVGDISMEPLTVDEMFWLAVGCLVAPAKRVYSLENVQPLAYTVGEEDEDEEDDSTIPNSRPPMSPAVRFDTPDSPDDDYDYRGRQWQPHISPNTYIIPSPIEGRAGRTERTIAGSWDPLGPRGFKFTETYERSDALSSLARSVEPANHDVKVFSLEEVELSEEEQTTLQHDSEATYVPLSSPWIRLAGGSNGRAWFLNRSDGQILAQALLNLPLCPQGYLINGNTEAVLRKTLCAASEALPQLLVRMITDIDSLVVEPADRNELLTAMDHLLARTLNYKYNRVFASLLFRLDEVLIRNLHPDKRANDAIGVLMITNPEFRSLIAQSLRHIPMTAGTSVTVDLAKSCLVMPTVMGVLQEFAIDFDSLFPGTDPRAPAITITYTMLLILSLRASLRSTFFETSVDSLPLFESHEHEGRSGLRGVARKSCVAYFGA